MPAVRSAIPQADDCTAAAAAARARFPRGLLQPAHGPRFGLDALLTAAFAAQYCCNKTRRQTPATLSVVELGCGCGAALLYLALRVPAVQGLGVDLHAPAVDAAVRNAALLGLAERLDFQCADIACINPALPPTDLAPVCGNRDMVLANPPYRLPGQGRPSPTAQREHAFCGREDAALLFCRAASRLLRRHGRFFCIFDATALPRLLAGCAAAHLGVRRIVPVRPYSSAPALRVLLEARKDAADDLRLESPLTLHTRRTAGTPAWSAQALRFCPALALPTPAAVLPKP